MDCHFVYAFVPRDSFGATLERASTRAARDLVERIAGSMELEEQGTSAAERARRVEELAAELRLHPHRIWDVGR